MGDLSAFSTKPRLRLLLDHFARIKDTRQSWKVAYPLREVLFLVVCGTIASSDDYEDIVDWGKAHLAFLRGFADLFIHQANVEGQRVGRVVVVQTTGQERAYRLSRQGGRYHVLVRGLSGGQVVDRVEESASIRRALVAAVERFRGLR